MKLTIAGVTFSAAPTRSPSFSRFSSSATITSLPAQMSAIACFMLRGCIVASRTPGQRLPRLERGRRPRGAQRPLARPGTGPRGLPGHPSPLDGETGAVHRDALALLQTLVGGLDREREPRFSFAVSRFPRRLRDSAHGTYDPGKHSRLSNTNNVSEPKALRSTGVQRGAAARGCAGTPGKAGTAPSPSHTGACTQ